jgi:hypothetical protein
MIIVKKRERHKQDVGDLTLPDKNAIFINGIVSQMFNETTPNIPRSN